MDAVIRAFLFSVHLEFGRSKRAPFAGALRLLKKLEDLPSAAKQLAEKLGFWAAFRRWTSSRG
jgi:hypothetical protein